MKLGDRVKDKIDGFEGIIVAKCHYLNGCIQYQVQPEYLDEHKGIKPEWIDEDQLELLMEDALTPSTDREFGEFLDKPKDENADLSNYSTGGPRKNLPKGMRHD